MRNLDCAASLDVDEVANLVFALGYPRSTVASSEVSSLVVPAQQVNQCLVPTLLLSQLFEDKRHYYIVTGVSEGGDLHREIKKRGTFDEVDAAVLMKQILICVNYCHKNKVVHRDLKPGSTFAAHGFFWLAVRFSSIIRFFRHLARRAQESQPHKDH